LQDFAFAKTLPEDWDKVTADHPILAVERDDEGPVGGGMWGSLNDSGGPTHKLVVRLSIEEEDFN